MKSLSSWAAPAARFSTQCWQSRPSPPSIPPSPSWSTSTTPWSSTPSAAGPRPAQQQEWLPRLASNTVGAYALSEAGSGSDAFALQTRAEPIKIGSAPGFRLNGRKLWISNAREAGLFIVFATLDPSAGYKGITAFLVEKGTPGFTVGRKEDKLGIRASSTCELIFDNCEVMEANLLGEPGKGYKIAIETLNEGRIGIGAQMLGLSEGAWGHAARYAKQRRQFGKPIAEFQAVQFTLAQMATEIEAAKLMVYNAARLKDAGQPYTRQAAMTKLFASEVAERDGEPVRRSLRRQRLCPRLPRREVLPRRQSRQNLRRHVQHAACHDCEAGSRQVALDNPPTLSS